MDNIQITFQTILAVLGALSVIITSVTTISRVLHPFTNLKGNVGELEDDVCNLKDNMNSLDETQKILCKSMLALLNHEITGNGIDKLKKQRDELEHFLIEK